MIGNTYEPMPRKIIKFLAINNPTGPMILLDSLRLYPNKLNKINVEMKKKLYLQFLGSGIQHLISRKLIMKFTLTTMDQMITH